MFHTEFAGFKRTFEIANVEFLQHSAKIKELQCQKSIMLLVREVYALA